MVELLLDVKIRLIPQPPLWCRDKTPMFVFSAGIGAASSRTATAGSVLGTGIITLPPPSNALVAPLPPPQLLNQSVRADHRSPSVAHVLEVPGKKGPAADALLDVHALPEPPLPQPTPEVTSKAYCGRESLLGDSTDQGCASGSASTAFDGGDDSGRGPAAAVQGHS